MRLSEIKGMDAIDVIANIMDPVGEIISDEEILSTIRAKKPSFLIAKVILQRKKKAILTILAYLNGEDPETFNPSLLKLPIMLVHLIEDVAAEEEMKDLFHLQDLMMEGASSGSATETTTETEEM